jgi:hypothetical protein
MGWRKERLTDERVEDADDPDKRRALREVHNRPYPKGRCHRRGCFTARGCPSSAESKPRRRSRILRSQHAVHLQLPPCCPRRLFQLVAHERDGFPDPFADQDMIADEPVWTKALRQLAAESGQHGKTREFTVEHADRGSCSMFGDREERVGEEASKVDKQEEEGNRERGDGDCKYRPKKSARLRSTERTIARHARGLVTTRAKAVRWRRYRYPHCWHSQNARAFGEALRHCSRQAVCTYRDCDEKRSCQVSNMEWNRTGKRKSARLTVPRHRQGENSFPSSSSGPSKQIRHIFSSPGPAFASCGFPSAPWSPCSASAALPSSLWRWTCSSLVAAPRSDSSTEGAGFDCSGLTRGASGRSKCST